MSITTKQFLREYRAEVDKHENYTEAAKHFGISRQFVKAVYDAKKIPGPMILAVMGFKPVKEINYRYERVSK